MGSYLGILLTPLSLGLFCERSPSTMWLYHTCIFIILLTKIPKICLCICLTLFVGRAWSSLIYQVHIKGLRPSWLKAQPWIYPQMFQIIIYESQWSLHVILVKHSSRVWSWFALETLVCLGILSNFFNKLPHKLIKFLKGHFKIHHLMHLWSTMSQESQENWRLASWLVVIGQTNSSGLPPSTNMLTLNYFDFLGSW